MNDFSVLSDCHHTHTVINTDNMYCNAQKPDETN